MAETVHIVIKNPSQSGDFRIEMPINNSVLQLKQKLEQSYDSRPPPANQKLIFAGRLLQDDALLSDILRQHDISIPQTFHLVIRPNAPPQPQATNAPNQQQFPQNIPPQQGPAMGPNGMGYQFQFGAGAGIGPGVGYGYPYYHQMYGMGYQYPPQYPGMHPQYPGMAQQPQPQPYVPPPPPPRPAGDGQHQHGPNHLSLLLKLAFLVFILSQGGSPERMLVLSLLALLVFFYQTGRFQMHMRVFRVNVNQPFPPHPHPQHPPPQQQQQQPQQQNPPPGQAQDQGQAQGQAQGQGQEPQPAQVQPIGVLGEIGQALSSFVYSLFPTWQPPAHAPPPQPPQ
jgi:hypothetical protein